MDEVGPKLLTELSLRHHASLIENPITKTEELRKLSANPADLKKVTQYVESRKSLTHPKGPPDGGFGWFIVLFAFLLHLVCGGTLYTLSVYYPTFLLVFDLSPTNISWISAIFFGCFFMCGPLAGILVEKWGTKATAFAGCFTGTCGLVIASFMKTYILVVFFMAVFGGFGTGCGILASVTSTVRWFEVKRGIAIGLVATGTGVGAAIFGPLVIFLIDKYGWDGCMLIESGLLFNGCLFALFLREVPRPKVHFGSVELIANSRHDEPGPNIPLMSVGDDKLSQATPPARKMSVNAEAHVQVFSDWKFWVFAISQFLIFFSCNAPLVYLVNRAVKDCHMPRMQASYLVSIVGVSSIFGRLFFAAVAGKLKTYKIWPFCLSMLISGITGMIVIMSNTFVAMAVYGGIFGLGYGTMVSTTSLVLVDYFGVSQIASVYGNLSFFRGLGFLAGPPLGGLIIAYTGGFHDILWISMGAVMAAGGSIIVFLPIVEKLLTLKRR